MHVCTAADRRHLPHVRVLLESVREHHPDARLSVLLLDADTGADLGVEGVEVVAAGELLVDAWATRLLLDDADLLAALTPRLLRRVATPGGGPVVFLAAGTWLLAGLDDLAGAARDHGVALVSVASTPMPRDRDRPDEQDVLLTGQYSGSVVAVGDDPGARAFLDWWVQRCDSGAHDDPARGYHLAQRWLDLAPGLFEHAISSDPADALSGVNLPGHALTEVDGSLLVDDHPVVVLDLTTYDVATPHLLGSVAAATRPRVLLSDWPVLRARCERFRELLLAAGARPEPGEPSVLEVDGVVVDAVVRDLVRGELGRAHAGLPERPGPPEVPLGRWLDSPDEQSRPGLGRYLSAVLDRRPDLVATYPGVASGRVGDFLDWVEVHGRAEMGIDDARLAAARSAEARGEGDGGDGGDGAAVLSRRPPGPRRSRPAPGLEVVGYLTAELGQGESARLFALAAERAGIDVSTVTYTRLSSRLGVEWDERRPPEGSRHDTVLLCVSPEALPGLADDLGRPALRGRYRIGLWFWELLDFPERLWPSLDLVDEIWTCSEFSAAAFRAHTDKPVVVLPHPAHPPAPSETRIPELGDSDLPTFLFVFDHLSVLERKNPMALVEAFTRAFPEPGEARLVVKSINGGLKQNDRERLRYLVDGRDDIVLVERYLSRAELDGLVRGCAAYVSLHRSEGFGQTLAEAMAAGRPVIATAFSGNLEFTRPDNSYLVPAAVVPVPPGCEPYEPPGEWGDPDVEQAAAAMRSVVDDPAGAERIARAGLRTIAEEHSLDALAGAMHRRLAEVERLRRATPAAPASPSDDTSTRDAPGPAVQARTALRSLARRARDAAGRRGA